MRLAAVVAGLLVLAGAAQAAPAPLQLDLDFRVPAQAQGGLSVTSGEWALLIFSPGSRADASVEAPSGGQATAYRDLKYRVDEDQASGTDSNQVGAEDDDLPSPFEGRAVFGAGAWGSLYIVADEVSFQAPRMDGSVERASEGRPPSTKLPDVPIPSGTFRRPMPPIPVESVTLGVRAIDLEADFTLHATGLRQIFWYNATVTCTTSGHCPDAPAYEGTRVPGRSTNGIEFRTYTGLTVDGGSLTMAGTMLTGAMGGAVVGLDVAGAVRLPLAVGNCLSTGCEAPDQQTFTASGRMALQDLRPMDEQADRVATRMVGHLESAAIDESFLEGLSAREALAGTALLAVLAIAVKFAVALFTRVQRPALDHPRTKRIHDLIRQQPGLSFTDLRRLAGAGTGNLRRHLTRLVDEGLVVRRDYRNSARFYENHGRYDSSWPAHAALQDEDNRRLHDWLLARPGSTQRQVWAGAAPDWSRSTLRHALSTLMEARLLAQEREGRQVYYWALPPRGPDSATAASPQPDPTITG